MTVSPEPRPLKLSHIVLRTTRFEELLQWWQTVLGAHVVHSSESLAFLTYDDEHHRLAILRNPDLGDDARANAGLEHVAFTYATLDDLVATYVRLRDAGVEPVLPINHGMTLSIYYADPDGNQVELQVDLMETDEAVAFMESDVFAENPLGVVFDPEEMVEEHDAGRPLSALALHGANT